MKQKLYITYASNRRVYVQSTDVHKKQKKVKSDMPSVRRSLTITEDNDIKVQNRRAMFLGGRNPTDVDYTTMVNVLIELGEMVFSQKWESGNVTLSLNEVIKVIMKHTESASLKDEALFDNIQDYWVKNFSKILNNYQKATQANAT
ncbi:Uncharacterised protein [uncultured archaeon]|nr:Uncharacterised protein [uncultured archaeon]